MRFGAPEVEGRGVDATNLKPKQSLRRAFAFKALAINASARKETGVPDEGRPQPSVPPL